MEKDQRKKRALISVYYKDGIPQFAANLKKLGYEIVSSGGTAKHLGEKGIEVVDVFEITGIPPILSHRVVTLHPKIHGGILAEKTPEHEEELKKYGIERFDIVCVDIYPVWEALGNQNATVQSVMGLTDIGGPTMLRAAAKNHNNGVTVICDPADRQRVIDELEAFGKVGSRLRQELAGKVFNLMARYDASIANFFNEENGILAKMIFMGNAVKLAYGENRNQSPAYLFPGSSGDPLALHRFLPATSGDPSYISLADGALTIHLVRFLAEAFRRTSGKVPYIAAVGKHANPCGLAFDWKNPAIAIQKALFGNPVSAMGGEFVCNFPVNDKLGNQLFASPKEVIGRDKWGLDVLFAPKFSPGSVSLLGKREKRRLLTNPALSELPFSDSAWILKQTPDGDWLMQRAQNFVLAPDQIIHWTGTPLNDEQFQNLLVAWVATWFASSNTVGIANDNCLIGLGAGQQDRIECARLCVDRARHSRHNIIGAVFASDGFFPFAESVPPKINKNYFKLLNKIMRIAAGYSDDPNKRLKTLLDIASDINMRDNREGTEILCDAGCIGGVVPADGNKLEQVKEFFAKKKMSVGFVSAENRGFSKH